MKKVVLVVFAAFLSLVSVNAQEKEKEKGFSKGDTYVSGTLGVRTVFEKDFASEEYNLEFSPSVGYFIDNNIALELKLFTSSSKRVNPIFGNEEKDKVKGVALGAVYYLKPLNDFSFTIGADFFYKNFNLESSPIDIPNYDVFGLTITPGLNYFISNSFSLKAFIGALSYSVGSDDFQDSPVDKTLSFNLDLSNVNFGLTYKF